MTQESFVLGPALLFCPADRPERYRKALQAADAVIIDLEDGVAPADRSSAREAIVAFGREAGNDASRVIVRVNPVGSPDHAADVIAVAATPFRTLMLAKTGSADDVAALAAAVTGAGVIALCETAKGVLAAPAIAAHPSTLALMWGAEDLIVSLRGTSSRTASGGYRDVVRQARSQILLASAAADAAAIDAVHLDLDDLEGLAEEAEDAVAIGFAATACLHPRQVETVRAAYRPSESELDWADRVIAAARDQPGAFRLDGRMIDAPVIAQARAVVRRGRGRGRGRGTGGGTAAGR